MREAASEVLKTDPTLEKHSALAETLERLDIAAKTNIAKA
jgi:hypothetical protein